MRSVDARLLAAIIAVATATTATVTAAQETIRAHVMAERLSEPVSHLQAAPDGATMLVSHGEQHWIVDASSRRVLRRYGPDHERDTVATGHHRMPRDVMRTRANDGTGLVRLIDPFEDRDLARVADSEDLLLLADDANGVILVTHNARLSTADPPPGPHHLAFRRRGDGAPYRTVELAPELKEASPPSVAVSSDGRSFALAHRGTVRLIEANATVRAIVMPDARTTDTAPPLFSDRDRRLIVATREGPFAVIDLATLRAVDEINVPIELARRIDLRAHADGQVLNVEGRRNRALIDVRTGKYIVAARGSSGSAYRLQWIDPDLVLRAYFPRGGRAATYGTYRWIDGDFQLLHRRETDRGIDIAASPNGACLFAAERAAKHGSGTVPASTAPMAAFHDLLTDQVLARVEGLARPINAARFMSDGRWLVGADDDQTLLVIAAPAKCHGGARR